MADRSVFVRLKGDVSNFNRNVLGAAATAKAFSKELDTSNDRMTNLVQTSLALGPALVPIGAAAVPALAGLTNQLAFAAAGAGVTALAFSGVGDALKAVNDFQLEPTTANFEKMGQALDKLGPAGRDFVGYLQTLRPELQKLQDAAQEGLLPGAEQGIRELMQLMPQAESIVSTVATALGDLLAEGGDNLNDARWVEFFEFLDAEARPTLLEMGRTLGNFTEGFANLWMAFAPLSRDFSSSFLDLSRDFSAWTSTLDETEGFQDFLAYIERVGPKAWDTLGALGNALVQIVTAAAPVGEVALPAIEAIADALALVAGSPAGPILIGAAAGIAALSRAVALYNVANGTAMTSMLTKLGGSGAVLRSAAAGAGIVALSLTDLDEKMNLSNTANLALLGTAILPGLGTAAGAAAGLVMDLASANDDLSAASERASSMVLENRGNIEEQAAAMQSLRDEINAGDSDGIFGVSDFDTDVARLGLARLEEQYGSNAEAAQEAKFEEAGLADAMAGSSQSARDQTEALLDNIDAMNARRDELLQSLDAELAYEAAIDAASDAAKNGADGVDKGTKEGRTNLALLYDLAAAYNAQTAEQQRSAGGAKRAKAAFIEAAVGMQMERGEAERLANQLFDIPKNVSTRYKLYGVPEAGSALSTLLGKINSLPSQKTIGIKVVGGTTTKMADGGYVTGPGGPRDDKVPAMLSNGEFVVNAAATARNLSLLQSINARRFADGGPVAADMQRMPAPAYAGATGSGGINLNGARLRLDSGALTIKGGEAYVSGIAQLVVAGQETHAASGRRAGRR